MFVAQLADDVHLRILERQDAAELFALTDASRDHLRRWLPWLDGTRSVTDTDAFLAGALEQFAKGRGFHAGIWRLGVLCGVAGLHAIDWANRQSSLGYWIGAGYEGQGLVTMACRAILDDAFGHYGLHRMELRAAVGNERSQAVARRLGFRREGVQRDAEWLYDHFVDHIVFGMLESEWRTQSGRWRE